jgi:hypothetical protein
MTKTTIAVLALLLLSGCGRSAKEGRESVDAQIRDRAIAAARQYIEREHPSWHPKHPWAVWRDGNKLHVVERLPKEMIGGGAVVVLDAETFEVVHAHHEQ